MLALRAFPQAARRAWRISNCSFCTTNTAGSPAATVRLGILNVSAVFRRPVPSLAIQNVAILAAIISSNSNDDKRKTNCEPSKKWRQEDLRDATLAKYYCQVPDSELSQRFNGVDIDIVNEEVRGITTMLQKAARETEPKYLEEMKAKSKFVYRHLSKKLGTQIPQQEGYTSWDLREMVHNVLKGSMSAVAARETFGVGQGTYNRIMESLRRKCKVKTNEDLKQLFRTREVSKEFLIDNVKKHTRGRPKLVPEAVEREIVAEAMSSDNGNASNVTRIASKIDGALETFNPDLKPRRRESARKHAARAVSRAKANSRKAFLVEPPEDDLVRGKLSALTSAVLDQYRTVQAEADQINNGYMFTAVNNVQEADTSLHASLRKSRAYEGKNKSLWLNADDLEELILNQVTSACPELEGSKVGVIQILLTKPKGPPQFIHLDNETPASGPHEKLGTMVLTENHPGTTYWEMDKAPDVVTVKDLEEKWACAPPELFHRLRESDDALEMIRQYGHLFWAEERNEVEREKVKRYSIALLDSCQPHCGPSTKNLKANDPRVTIFFTITPNGFKGKRYSGGKQMSREKLTYKIYDALSEKNTSPEIDSYLLSKFTEYVGASARRGTQDDTLMDWEAEVSEEWKSKFKEGLGATMKSEEKVKRVEREEKKRHEQKINSLNSKKMRLEAARKKVAAIEGEIEEYEKKLAEKEKASADKIEAAKNKAAMSRARFARMVYEMERK